MLNFKDNVDQQRATDLERCRTAAPGSSRTTGGVEQPRVTGPEQPRTSAPQQPTQEINPITNLPLFSTPMDNIIAIQAAVNNLEAMGACALQINYVKALVTKSVEQQHAHCDSQGPMYSHSMASRAASSVARHAAECTITNVNNGPPPGQQQ
jgi:hypothetical protein